MSAPLRVMHVVLSLAPGGAERLVIDLSRRLRPQVPVSICCLDDAGPWAEGARAEDIPVTALRRRPGFHPGLGLRVAALAERHRANVIHCHQYSPFVYGALAGLRRPGLRIVFTEHGRLAGAERSAKRAWVNRVLGRRLDRIVAVSDDLRAQMIAEGFAASRVEVIHNGIDPGPVVNGAQAASSRRLLGLPGDGLVVGTVARFDPVKRLDVLIDAFAAVRRRVPGSRLLLIGDGPERQRLEALAAARGLTGATTFCGLRDDARALMPGLDIYVNSSASEGVSLTVLEAMASSRPVVATRVGGTPEVIRHGQSGLLVPPEDSGAVADAVADLWADPDRRHVMGAAARETVLSRFSLDRMTQAYLAAYTGPRAVD